MPPQGSATKHWCFTLNNPTQTQSEIMELLKPVSTYAVFQLEKAATPHYQGYAEFKKVMRITSLNKIFQAHWSKRHGTRVQARDYCMKEDTRESGPWESDVFPVVAAGKRNDITDAYRLRRGGATMSETADAFPNVFMRCNRALNAIQYLDVQDQPSLIFTPKTCQILYGKTRTGKTRYAYAQDPDLYKLPITKSNWFDGYTGQKTILFDDFNGNVNLTKMLQYLDGYNTQVEVKCSMVWLHATHFFITCNDHPTSWWPERSEDQKNAFYSRCNDELIEFPKEEKVHIKACTCEGVLCRFRKKKVAIEAEICN